MLEHDYLMLTEKVHQCILQDLEGDDSKMTCALPVSHLMYNNIEEEEFGLKKGEEQVLSTQKYVPKTINYVSEDSGQQLHSFKKQEKTRSFI